MYLALAATLYVYLDTGNISQCKCQSYEWTLTAACAAAPSCANSEYFYGL